MSATTLNATTQLPRYTVNVTENDEALRAFVRKHVRSIGELEVLLWLRAHPQRAWTADEIARELRNNRNAATEYLRRFGRAGLARETEVGRYQYVDDATTHELVTALADAYAERPVSVVDLIYAEPRDQVQLLADAFRIKKDKD